MAETMPPLCIIAQPKALYRSRYLCEGRPNHNRAQRFVRADDNPDDYIYPTIGIPQEWIRGLQQPMYIRVSHVTVHNEVVNVRCVHPYSIATEDMQVRRDAATNTLFFPVSEEELASGRKSFQFTLYKLTQYQLRTYGPLQVLDTGEMDEQRVEDPTDTRKIIDIYRLAQSQLLFSIAVFQDNQPLPIIYAVSSVFSHVMTATTTQANEDDLSVRCSPQRGDAQGGEEVLMVIPRVDKRKAFSVRFDHPLMNQQSTVNMVFVDTKTISFYTPPCPVLLTRKNPSFSVPIVVIQNDVELARIPFVYQSMDTSLNSDIKKRSFSEIDEDEDVSGNDLTGSGMEKPTFDYSQAQNSIPTARVSPTSVNDQFFELENAIQQGDIDLAVKLLRQSNSYLERANDRGETPLLIAARCNQNQLILAILQEQSGYAKQVDNHGNNLLHLLATVPDNRARTSIDSVFTLLDDQLKEQLISQRNRIGYTPDDVARMQRNRKYIDLFSRQISLSDSN